MAATVLHGSSSTVGRGEVPSRRGEIPPKDLEVYQLYDGTLFSHFTKVWINQDHLSRSSSNLR